MIFESWNIFFLCIIYFWINSQVDYAVFRLINESIHLSSA